MSVQCKSVTTGIIERRFHSAMEILVIVIRRPTILGAFHTDVFSIQGTKAVGEIPLCFKVTPDLLPFLSCLWNFEILSLQALPNCMDLGFFIGPVKLELYKSFFYDAFCARHAFKA